MISKQYVIFILQHKGHCHSQMTCKKCPISPCIPRGASYDYELKKDLAFAKAKKLAIQYLTEYEIFEACL